MVAPVDWQGFRSTGGHKPPGGARESGSGLLLNLDPIMGELGGGRQREEE